MDFDYIFNQIKGKTIAVIYAFEGEDAIGAKHYHFWKSNIISGWINAIQSLNGLPLILDVRTFAQKIMHNTLPKIDYVLNLNCGHYELSTLSLVPSLCSFAGLRCIPCNAMSIIAGEHKKTSNLIASQHGIKVPRNFCSNNKQGIVRPCNLGSSIGVKKCNTSINEQDIHQEFIEGYDITIPLAYNPLTRKLDMLQPLIYIPKTLSTEWFFSEQEKIKDNGFNLLIFENIAPTLVNKLIEFTQFYDIKTYARIDVRLRTKSQLSVDNFHTEELNIDNCFFIEINSMPTIETEDSFEYALSYILKNKEHSFYKFASYYSNKITPISINGFLLACSLMSFLN